MPKPVAFAAAVVFAIAPTILHAADYRSIREEVVVPVDANAAWSLWTSNEGVRSFFPAAYIETNIDLRPGGPYEFVFLKDNPPGERGCDDCRILGYQEGRMLPFTWTNRPNMAVRPHRTHVILSFEPLSKKTTRVALVADGWGEGAEWDEAYDYFSTAWASVLKAYKEQTEAIAGAQQARINAH